MADPRFSGKLIAVIGDEVGNFYFLQGESWPFRRVEQLGKPRWWRVGGTRVFSSWELTNKEDDGAA